jgi:hypothetical protein
MTLKTLLDWSTQKASGIRQARFMCLCALANGERQDANEEPAVPLLP